jgi:endoribonuclease Dicer
VSLLIFDECHRACGSHPYARIMKEFYFGSQWRPDVFGMTASPVATKGKNSTHDNHVLFCNENSHVLLTLCIFH